MIKINEREIINACNTSNTMSEACSKTNLHYNTFINYAKKLNCYKPNPGGKNTNKPKRDGFGKISLKEILNGLHPSYQTFKLKHRLYNESIFENKCSICGIKEWNGFNLQCELDHIDGNSRNHRLSNLRILCPNCHSQTSNFRAKNIK